MSRSLGWVSVPLLLVACSHGDGGGSGGGGAPGAAPLQDGKDDIELGEDDIDVSDALDGNGAGGQFGDDAAPTGGRRGDGGATSVFDVDREQFCEGGGAIPIPGQEQCTADLAKQVFRFAICSCSDFRPQGVVFTDSIDSAKDEEGLDGGSVGINGDYDTNAQNDFQGALYVGGSYRTGNTHNVEQDLWCQDTAVADAVATVGKDAYIGGLVSTYAGQEMSVAGTLYTPLAANKTAVNADSYVNRAIDVPEPCDCSNPVDIASIVDAFAKTNDNDDFFIAADELVVDPNYPKEMTLECGRYYLSGISANQTVSLTVQGRVVLAVDGDIDMSGNLDITLDPGAELDLFVSGSVFLGGNDTAIGDANSPKSTRFYVAGEDVTMTSDFELSANFYMPNAVFNVKNDELTLNGAFFAQDIVSTAKITVHYDEGIVNVDGCREPDEPCESCADCVNPYPSCGDDGECGPCETNSDCCPPLVCDATGLCVPPKTGVR